MQPQVLSDIPVREPVPGYRGRFVHSAFVTIAAWEIAAGAPLPEHAHPHEQVVNVVEGTMEITAEGATHVLTPGTVLVIPGNVPHAGRARTACRIIDVFHPIREDYR